MAQHGSKHWFLIVFHGFVVIGVFAALSTLAAGRQVYLWASNRQPVRLTLAEYLRTRPTGEWLELRDAHLRFDLAITFEDSKKQKLSSLFVPAWPTDDTSEPVQFVVDATKTRLQQAEEGKLPASWVGLVSGVRRPAIFAQHSDPSTARLPWRPAAQTIELIEGDAPSGRSAFIWTLAAVGLWTYAAWAIVDFRKRDSMGRWIGNAAGGGGAMLDGSELDR